MIYNCKKIDNLNDLKSRKDQVAIFNRKSPTDPNEARVCKNLKKANYVILFFSSILYVVGLFFAFFAADIFY